jgi:hypothetical protein
LKKSKITLLFNALIIILFLILLVVLFFIDKKSLYTGEETKICGYITNLKKDKDKLTIEIKNKEKIIGYYYFNDDLYNYNLGDEICLYGNINEIENNRIFNLFNYKKYLLSKNIHYKFNIDKIELVKNNTKLKYKIKNIIKKKSKNTFFCRKSVI